MSLAIFSSLAPLVPGGKSLKRIKKRGVERKEEGRQGVREVITIKETRWKKCQEIKIKM
jgi:hypothetical protein